MALQLSINTCVKSNCQELIFSETTGVYSEANPGGYGVPNITVQDVNSCELVVTAPNGTEYTISQGSLTGFPTNNDDYEFSIPLALLGGRTSIEDGYWTFTYTITTTNETYTVTVGKVFTCSVNCCIQNILAKIRLDKCDSCDKYYTYADYVKAVALRDSLTQAASCGDTEYIENTLEILTKLCNKLKCKTCK